MIPNFGYSLILITFALCLYGAWAAIYGYTKKEATWIETARYAMWLTFPLITLSIFSLLYLLVNNHFEVVYVYQVINTSMPTYLKITALWGGQSGSLLFWSWLMSAFAALLMLQKWEQQDRELLPWVIIVISVTLLFFLGMSVFIENPFIRFWQMSNGEIVRSMFPPNRSLPLIPVEGQGLNPLLRHPGMILHPPMLYLGFVSSVIPFAYAIASLMTGRIDDRWTRTTRRWILTAWLFLSMGLILGMRWAYDVLGWGGYWGWDPVEISALMPWLTGTALLHSVMIQERRGMLKRWNMVLAILTYDLVIFGTFLTRSGVLSSVHSFAQSAIGPLFFIYIGLTLTASLAVLLIRWDSLKSEAQMTSLLSRESLFLFNNLLFMGILIVCFWGVVFPLISEWVMGQKITVGPPFYRRATGPLFAGLLVLMGIAPLVAWRRTTARMLGRSIWKPTVLSILAPIVCLILGIRQPAALLGFWLIAFVICVTLYEYGRGALIRRQSTGENIFLAFWCLAKSNRRRYGGYIVHLGIVLMAIGILGIELFQTETQGTIPVNGQLTLNQYTLTYRSMAEFDTPDGRSIARAVVGISKNGKPIGELYPRRDYYYLYEQAATIPGVWSTMEDDLYVILIDWLPISSEGATFKVFHNPLVNWLWLGGMVLILGMVVAILPSHESKKVFKPTLVIPASRKDKNA